MQDAIQIAGFIIAGLFLVVGILLAFVLRRLGKVQDDAQDISTRLGRIEGRIFSGSDPSDTKWPQ